MWDLPGPELEPVSPALAGGFLTTAPPGKPLFLFLQLVCEFEVFSKEKVILKFLSQSLNNYPTLVSIRNSHAWKYIPLITLEMRCSEHSHRRQIEL